MQTAFNYFVQQLAETKHRFRTYRRASPHITPTLANGQADPTTLLAKLKIVYANCQVEVMPPLKPGLWMDILLTVPAPLYNKDSYNNKLLML